MDGTISIPLAEEEVSVGVERRTTGRVRVGTVTGSFEEHVSADVESSDVDVQRVQVGRVVEAVPEIRVDGDVTIIPVIEEVLVIEKRLVLKEELHVTRTRVRERIEVPVTLRRQEVMIERITPRKTEETDMENYGSQAYGNRTLTAFFRDRSDAEEAARELAEAGIAQDAIRLVPGTEPDSVAATDVDADRRGFWEALGDFFFPDDDREVYAEGLRRGGYLVTVNAASEDQHSMALDILDDEGTIDVDEWSDTWRADGWTPSSTGLDRAATSTRASQAAGMSEDAFAAERATGADDNVIPVVEERLNIGKRDVDSGTVRVRSYVVETPVSETVNLRNENVSVERRPVDRPVADAEAAFADRTIEAEEYREEPVVSKSAKVTEEVVLKKSESERTEKIDDSVRHTEIEVEDNRSGQSQNAQGQRQGGQGQDW